MLKEIDARAIRAAIGLLSSLKVDDGMTWRRLPPETTMAEVEGRTDLRAINGHWYERYS